MAGNKCDETLSPCVGICQYNEEEVCRGCFRTSEEISRWAGMLDEEKLKVMATLDARMESLF